MGSIITDNWAIYEFDLDHELRLLDSLTQSIVNSPDEWAGNDIRTGDSA
jgi:hypothetical protein